MGFAGESTHSRVSYSVASSYSPSIGAFRCMSSIHLDHLKLDPPALESKIGSCISARFATGLIGRMVQIAFLFALKFRFVQAQAGILTGNRRGARSRDGKYDERAPQFHKRRRIVSFETVLNARGTCRVLRASGGHMSE